MKLLRIRILGTFILIAIAALTAGCDDPMMIMKPIVQEPQKPSTDEMPTTTMGEMKEEESSVGDDTKDETPQEEEPSENGTKDEMPQEEEPAEGDVEPQEEEMVVIPADRGYTLPAEYSLPEYLIPDMITTSMDEDALITANEQVGIDVTKPRPGITNAGLTADLISLLPVEEREEVYDLFVASVDLPFFAEAAEKWKQYGIQFMLIGRQAQISGDWSAYNEFQEKVYWETGIFSEDDFPELTAPLKDIYFEENPQHTHEVLRPGYGRPQYSRYWMYLEWYRLQLEHDDLPFISDKRTPEGYLIILEDNFQEMVDLYRESCENGLVFGLDNPWK